MLQFVDVKRLNSGRYTSATMNEYKHCEAGGWWCDGVGGWGCFKPDAPKTDQDGKIRKYEHPKGAGTATLFQLQVPDYIWRRIADRYNISIQEDDDDFWTWVECNPAVTVYVTEGAKKAGALLSQGYAAIALPGIYGGIRQPKDEEGQKNGERHLLPELEAFCQSGRKFVMAFDQDEKRKTVINVSSALRTTGNLLAKASRDVLTGETCDVFVLEWSHDTKGIDDYLLNLTYEAKQQLEYQAIHFKCWNVKQMSGLSHPIDLPLNSRFLPTIDVPPGTKLVALKSPKKTGKTEQMSRMAIEHTTRGGRLLVITHRVQLGQALCDRFGINYITGAKSDDRSLGLCVDSLHPNSQAAFDYTEWKGALVIIDEVEQVIWHMLNSSTCQKERVAILDTFKKLLRFVVETGGRIVIGDADLSDLAIDYICALVGADLKPWIVNNKYVHEGYTVYEYGGSDPSQLVSALELDIEQGGKQFLCVSGQKKKSQWGTQNLEAYFQKRFPGRRILRIDSESVADPDHPAYGCMSNLNEILPNYDMVIASPTIETGVDIKIEGHFSSVWSISQGIQPVASVCQALYRVREDVTRHLWAKEVGISQIGNGESSPKALLASQHRLTKANIMLLTQAGFDDELDFESHSESLNGWAKRGCIINDGMRAYRSSIIDALAAEGHTILPADDPSNTLTQSPGFAEKAQATKAIVKEVKTLEYAEHCDQVKSADLPDDRTYQALKDKRSKTKDERHQFQKGTVQRKYRVPVTADLVSRDDAGWYPLIRLDYYLHPGREYLTARDVVRAEQHSHDGDGVVFQPDFNKTQMMPKIRLLESMGFGRLLEQREYAANDPEILRIADFCKLHPKDVRMILGISIGQEQSPMAIAQMLVGLIAYKFPRLRRQGKRKQQIQIYGPCGPDFKKTDDIIVEVHGEFKKKKGKLILDENGQAIVIPDGRNDIFTAWLARDAELAAERTTAIAAAVEKAELAPVRPLVASVTTEPIRQTSPVDDVGGDWLDQSSIEDMVQQIEFAVEDADEGAAAFREMLPFWPKAALQKTFNLLKENTITTLRSWGFCNDAGDWGSAAAAGA